MHFTQLPGVLVMYTIMRIKGIHKAGEKTKEKQQEAKQVKTTPKETRQKRSDQKKKSKKLPSNGSRNQLNNSASLPNGLSQSGGSLTELTTTPISLAISMSKNSHGFQQPTAVQHDETGLKVTTWF